MYVNTEFYFLRRFGQIFCLGKNPTSTVYKYRRDDWQILMSAQLEFPKFPRIFNY